MNKVFNGVVKNYSNKTDEETMNRMIRQLKNQLNKEKTFQVLRRHRDSYNHRHLKKKVSENRRKRIQKIMNYWRNYDS